MIDLNRLFRLFSKQLSMFHNPTLSYFAREALMQRLTTEELKEFSYGADIDLAIVADRILRGRARRKRYTKAAHRLNYPIQEVLDDYVNHRKGKLREAKRQLRKRFDGLDHDMQERIMLTFMEQGELYERSFIYEKLYGEDFWMDAYIPLVEAWWEDFGENKLAKVVIKRCPKEYLLKHWDELKDCGSYVTLCIRTGTIPDPNRLTPQTYLYVVKSINGQLMFREGELTVLTVVRDYLYKPHDEMIADTIYAVPHVYRMMAYLGEMGMEEDILSLDAFDRRMSHIPHEEWASAVIQAIEEEFPMPSFKGIK